jgi:6-phosphogluconolactonase
VKRHRSHFLACAACVSAILALSANEGAAVANAPFTPAKGSPFAAGDGASADAFNPAGTLLATSNTDSNNVSVLAFNEATGALKPVSGSPFPAGDGPDSVAFSPTGKLLAAADAFSNKLRIFSVDSAGRLTPAAGSPVQAPRGVQSATFSPDGKLLVTANEQSNTLSIFSVNAATGRLTQVKGSPFAGGERPDQVAFNPTGALLAVADNRGSISMFTVHPASGQITQVSGSPFATGTAPNLNPPRSIAFSPTGALLATSSPRANNVSVFSVSAGGALTEAPGSPMHVSPGGPTATGFGAVPVAVTFNVGGNLLVTANAGGGNVSAFSVTSNGALTAITGSPFKVGVGPSWVGFSPNGKWLATLANDKVSVLSTGGAAG